MILSNFYQQKLHRKVAHRPVSILHPTKTFLERISNFVIGYILTVTGPLHIDRDWPNFLNNLFSLTLFVNSVIGHICGYTISIIYRSILFK